MCVTDERATGIAARRAIEDAPGESDDLRAAEGGEADFERSSEHEDELG